jgi:hypothetical protein
MTKSLSATIAILFSCVSLPAAVVPILQERFNDTSSLEYLNGAEQGPDKSGVSGKAGDKAYSAKVDVPDPSQPQPGAMLLDSSLLSNDLRQFTVTLWYKTNREVQDPDSLLHLGGFYLLWDKVRGWTMRLELPPGGEPFSSWFNAGIKGPLLASNAEGEWIFYAISWDLDARTCVIYQGTTSESVEVFRDQTNFEVPGPVKAAATNAIGNNFDSKGNTVGTRPFSGGIDNIRIYDKALDHSAIEAIRTADLANTDPSIP